MPRPPRAMDEKRVRINVTIGKKVLEACDAVAEACEVSRVDVLELGLCKVFEQFIDILEEQGGESNA